MGRLQGVEICPNYLVALNALAFPEQNLYSAHEIAQMVPLYGIEIYWHLRHLNRWSDVYLPNATGAPELYPLKILPEGRWRSKRLGEWFFNLSWGDVLEGWELRRKQSKFARLYPASEEALFNEHVCKGHFGAYQGKTLRAVNEWRSPS